MKGDTGRCEQRPGYAGRSHVAAVMMFDFQDKCCVMSLIKLHFNN